MRQRRTRKRVQNKGLGRGGLPRLSKYRRFRLLT
ncbi:hypothetical protein DM52_2869 [Burkholderia mallei]|nr:hypothetical protein DM52_2869 [Burkholderia mallei]